MSRKYLWRVTAHFTEHKHDGTLWREWTTVRHYQSLAAARHNAAVLTGAVEPANPEVAWLPRADQILIERSAPIDGWQAVS